jgi:hypothetical protein
VEPGNQWLTAQVKAGVFMDALTMSWVDFSHWSWICRLSQVNWFGFHLYWGRGNNLEIILLISPVADLSDLVPLL